MRKIIAIGGVLLLLGFMSYQFLFKKDQEKFLEKGIEYYNQKKYREALFYFENAEVLNNTDALKYSGSIYLESGNPQQAIPKFEKYLKLKNSDDENRKFILNDLGVAYFKINDVNNAKKYWKKAAESGNVTSLNNLRELDKK